MSKSFYRIVPRVAHYDPREYSGPDTEPSEADTEALLFLPDLDANPGYIACYARVGEHGEASLEFYRGHTSPPDMRAKELCNWYVENKCDENDIVKIQQRIKL